MRDKTNAIAWLERAKKNLEYAKCDDENDSIAYEDRCNQCSQAAEKAFKAVLILKHGPNYSPPRGKEGHELNHLINKLEAKGVSVPLEIKNAALRPYYVGGFTFPLTCPFTLGCEITLNDNAVNTKYPSGCPPFTKKNYISAFEKAQSIVNWAEQQVSEIPKECGN